MVDLVCTWPCLESPLDPGWQGSFNEDFPREVHMQRPRVGNGTARWWDFQKPVWLPHTTQVLWRQRSLLRHTQGYISFRIAVSPDSAQVKALFDLRILFYFLINDDSLFNPVLFPNSVIQYTCFSLKQKYVCQDRIFSMNISDKGLITRQQKELHKNRHRKGQEVDLEGSASQVIRERHTDACEPPLHVHQNG